MTPDLEIKQRVTVVGIGIGWIAKVRHDDAGEPIYTVLMDDATASADGIFYARRCELAGVLRSDL
jgi:hypothetical protein